MKYLSVLGSTGSIGSQTLDIVRAHRNKLSVFLLAAKSSVDLIYDQCLEFCPTYAYLEDFDSANALRSKLKDNLLVKNVIVLDKDSDLIDIVQSDSADIVVSAMIGVAGLQTFFAAINSNKQILLANKEILVTAGHFLYNAINNSKSELIPIDSEHNAVFQCLKNPDISKYPLVKESMGVSKIILTASGGPFFRNADISQENITPEQACNHPNWKMGKKISIDSATFMNKALEVVEAKWLFGKDVDDIEIFIHPQSIIHGMVKYDDGSIVSGMSYPDMRIHIAHALAYPDRFITSYHSDLNSLGNMEFYPVDEDRFKPIKIVKEIMTSGDHILPIYFNASNEVFVSAFLDGKIKFNSIIENIQKVLDKAPRGTVNDLETIAYYDNMARIMSKFLVDKENN